VSQIAKHPQIATGAAGGISGAVGNVIGQFFNNGRKFSCINWTNTLIAGIVGIGAGALAVGTTSPIQAAMLGGESNLLQYFMTQFVNGDTISMPDLLLSYGTGFFAGRLGGPYEPDQLQLLLGHPSPSLATRTEIFRIQAQTNLKPILLSNLGRNILSAIFTNVDLTDGEFFEPEDDCGSSETPVEEQRPTSQTDQHVTLSQTLQRTADVNFCTN
jgi:hypothetical protein